MRKITYFIFYILLVLVFTKCMFQSPNWKFSKSENGWELLKDGSPFFIKGGVTYNQVTFTEALAESGGNSIRINADVNLLRDANEKGLYALVNLPVKGERDGMDWDDDYRVKDQENRILSIVDRFKNHPSVMMWSIGNELRYVPNKKGPHNPRMWNRLNDLAILIKKKDPRHPVGFCLGVHSPHDFSEIARVCTAIDFLGINTYGYITQVGRDVESTWKKPFVISEWGTNALFEAEKTDFKANIEVTSNEKALLLKKRYVEGVLSSNYCVGSFAFFWGQRKEFTPTWFGLFSRGSKTEAINVLRRIWTGDTGINQAPIVEKPNIINFNKQRSIYLDPETEYSAEVSFIEPENEPVNIEWEIRPEVITPKGAYAGKNQTSNESLHRNIKERYSNFLKFKSPKSNGIYRLYVYVTDNDGNEGYSNKVFHVGEYASPSP